MVDLITIAAEPAGRQELSEQNFDEYKQAVERLADNRSEVIFNNDKSQLASIVMGTIIKYAYKNVRIYESCLDGDIGDTNKNFLKALETFVTKGNTVKLVLREDKKNKSTTYNKVSDLAEQYPELMQIKIATTQFRTNIKDVLKNDIYFIVNDNCAYRMETTENIAKERKAICSFNDPKMTEKLINAFDRNFENCAPAALVSNKILMSY